MKLLKTILSPALGGLASSHQNRNKNNIDGRRGSLCLTFMLCILKICRDLPGRRLY